MLNISKYYNHYKHLDVYYNNIIAIIIVKCIINSMSEHIISIGHNRAAYLCSISIFLFTVYLYDIWVITDKRVHYSEELLIGLCIFIGFMSIIMIWTLLVYNKYLTGYNRTGLLLFKSLSISSGLFLLYFGFQTIHIDEIINKNTGGGAVDSKADSVDISDIIKSDGINDYHTSYEYLVTKDHNDFASVISILCGIFTIIMTILF